MAAEKLSRDSVVDRAIDLIDAEGLEAVTVRRLAQEFGVTPMALYWHFKNKDELLAGVTDHLLTQILAEVTDADWNVQVRAMVERLVSLLDRHPAMAPLLQTVDKHVLDSFNMATDMALELLKRGGFTVQEGFLVSSYLLSGAIGLVGGAPVCPPPLSGAEAREWRRRKRLQIENLSAERFPMLMEFAKTFEEEADASDYYTYGVDLLMAGVETMAARAPHTTLLRD
ncbi:TetR/AcrR family transcriptional regulator [Herbidospora mongoliensis]|uniref:TetR/AcrR family transcriptional regulator n=1 Tax=Herbidospora mongoliensis TaxID=688067 RepID=UPI00082B0823|nr:TetR family transcriptional regulator [Herbidospora mongoliensis]